MLKVWKVRLSAIHLQVEFPTGLMTPNGPLQSHFGACPGGSWQSLYVALSQNHKQPLGDHVRILTANDALNLARFLFQQKKYTRYYF